MFKVRTKVVELSQKIDSLVRAKESVEQNNFRPSNRQSYLLYEHIMNKRIGEACDELNTILKNFPECENCGKSDLAFTNTARGIGPILYEFKCEDCSHTAFIELPKVIENIFSGGRKNV